MTKRKKTIMWIGIGVISVLLTIFLVGFLMDVFEKPQKVSFSELSQLIYDGQIQELYIDGYEWTGYTVKNGDVVAKYVAIGPAMYSSSEFLDRLLGEGVKVCFADPDAGGIWSKLLDIFKRCFS